MKFYVVHNETKDTYFVGTGGQFGGSTAFRGKVGAPPKLYATAGRAKGALTMCKNYKGLAGDVIKVKEAQLLVWDEQTQED